MGEPANIYHLINKVFQLISDIFYKNNSFIFFLKALFVSLFYLFSCPSARTSFHWPSLKAANQKKKFQTHNFMKLVMMTCLGRFQLKLFLPKFDVSYGHPQFQSFSFLLSVGTGLALTGERIKR